MSAIQVGQSFKGPSIPPYLMINVVFSGDRFLFIPIKNSNDGRTKRLARSHAVSHGLRNKRRLQQSSGHNFHVLCPENNHGPSARKEKRDEALIAPPASVAVGSSDAFQMLAAESPIIRALSNRGKTLEITRCPTMAHIDFGNRKVSTNSRAGFQRF